ncbi:MAG: hypothetical protein WD942_06340 [Dehalococcoidia bacterium]
MEPTPYWQRARRDLGTRVLTLLIWAASVYGFATAFTFNERARSMPIIILGALVLFASAEVLRQWSPWKLADEAEEAGKRSTFGEVPMGTGTGDDPSPVQAESLRTDEDVSGPTVGHLGAIAIVLLYFVAAILLGFDYVTPVFVFLLTWRYGKHSILLSVLLAVGVYLALTVVFKQIFGVATYDGMFF